MVVLVSKLRIVVQHRNILYTNNDAAENEHG